MKTKNMTIIKGLLVVVLVIAMLLSTIPTTAFTAFAEDSGDVVVVKPWTVGENTYETFADAMDAVAVGGTITLTESVEISATCMIAKSVTVDLGGFEVTTPDVVGNPNDLVNGVFATNSADAEITIKNGTIDTAIVNKTIFVYSAKQCDLIDLTIKNTYDVLNSEDEHVYGYGIYVSNTSAANISNCTIESLGNGIYATSTSAVEVSGGSVTVTGTKGAIQAGGSANLSVTDCIIASDGNGVCSVGTSKVVVDGCDITAAVGLSINENSYMYVNNCESYKEGASYGALVTNGELFVENSTIKSDYAGMQAQLKATVTVGEGAKISGPYEGGRGITMLPYSGVAPTVLVNDGAEVTGGAGVLIWGAGDLDSQMPKLIVNGGTIGDENSQNAIIGNGLDDFTYIEINGGTLEGGQNMAISHPQTGDLIINGGTIKGPTGIQYGGAGKFEMNGGHVIGYDEKVDLYKNSDDGDGAIHSAGSALIFASRGAGYQDEGQTMDISITGGTIESLNNPVLYVLRMGKDGNWVFNKDAEGVANYLSNLSITGGTFVGKAMSIEELALSEGVINIKGGTFDSAPSGAVDTAKDVVENTDIENAVANKDAINNAVGDVVGYDKVGMAEDKELVETVNKLDELFVAANDKISVTENKVEIDSQIAEEDKLPVVSGTQSSNASGLAVAVYGDKTTLPTEGVDLYIKVAQNVVASDSKADIAVSIKPYQTVGTTETAISNGEIKAPVTFSIYLPTSYEAKKVVVRHIFDDAEANLYGKAYEEHTLDVLTDANGNYITMTVTHFSNFEIREYVAVGGFTVIKKDTVAPTISVDSNNYVTVTDENMKSVSVNGDVTQTDVDEVGINLASYGEGTYVIVAVDKYGNESTKTIVIEGEKEPTVTPTEPTVTPVEPVTPEPTNNNSMAIVWIVLGVVAVVGVAVVIVRKRK